MTRRPTAMYPGDFTPSPGASVVSQWHIESWPKGNQAEPLHGRAHTLLAMSCFQLLWPLVATIVTLDLMKGMKR